jgi:hypothetical protein
MEKLGSPDEIIQLNGHEVQFVWKNIPVDQYNRYLAKAKVDLYGDGSLTVPGRYDDDGWLEEWL